MNNVEVNYRGCSVFEIKDSNGNLLDRIGLFPGSPDWDISSRFFYLVRGLEEENGRCKGLRIGYASTIDEAEWVSHGLAVEQAKHFLQEFGEGELIDTTLYSNRENPYRQELESAKRLLEKSRLQESLKN